MIPLLFIERLKSLFADTDIEAILHSFSSPEVLSIRVNLLKSSLDEVQDVFKAEGIMMDVLPWLPDAFILRNISRDILSRHALVISGKIYVQSVSSMIPAVVLNPKPEENILDACAAPGSKTTQMAMMMKNEGSIIAVEAVKARFFRLKSVVQLLGVLNVVCKLCDVRRYKCHDTELFDRILVDAPCSSEGRFKSDNPKSTGYWSLRKIKEMSFKQKGILLSASRLLKSQGVLVYATCTFSPEENEEVVDWFLRKSGGAFELEDINLTSVPRATTVVSWGKDVYHPDVVKCLRVKPCQDYTGFFVAKFKKL